MSAQGEGARALAPLVGDGGGIRAVTHAQDAVRAHPGDVRAAIGLAHAFVQYARDTEDPGYYVQAQDALALGARLDPHDVEVARMQGLLLLQAHRFREARDAARALVDEGRDRSTETYGILCDAQTELGDYDAAVAAAQQMMDLRPDTGAYTRASWLRWLMNDWQGALDVMRIAMDALPRAPEARAWVTTQLGVLYWNVGDLTIAEQTFRAALVQDATYSAAHAGLARVLLARGDAQGAAREALAAVTANPTAEHEWLAVDTLTAAGRTAEADTHRAALERLGLRTDPRTLSLFLSTRGEGAEQALDLARREHENRQDVFTDDVLAWALFRTQRMAEASAAIQRAQRTGIHDARILFHAGMIAQAQGDHAGAVRALTAALAQNPYWDAAEAAVARRTLTQLGAPSDPPLARTPGGADAPAPPSTDAMPDAR